MGSDIHGNVEQLIDGRWQRVDHNPFTEGRNYEVFAFLADVRNYAHVPVIAEPRGLPSDADADEWVTDGYGDYHSHSWLTVAEMLAYDYEQTVWNRRVTKNGNGAALAEEGEGTHEPLREILGSWYFECLDRLAAMGDPARTRIVFWFDS